MRRTADDIAEASRRDMGTLIQMRILADDLFFKPVAARLIELLEENILHDAHVRDYYNNPDSRGFWNGECI